MLDDLEGCLWDGFLVSGDASVSSCVVLDGWAAGCLGWT